jgi:hypothetical protein
MPAAFRKHRIDGRRVTGGAAPISAQLYPASLQYCPAKSALGRAGRGENGGGAASEPDAADFPWV